MTIITITIITDRPLGLSTSISKNDDDKSYG